MLFEFLFHFGWSIEQNYLGRNEGIGMGGVIFVHYIILSLWQQAALKWMRQDLSSSGRAQTWLQELR